MKAFHAADADVLDEGALAMELEAALARARAAWPDVSVAGEQFAEALGRHSTPAELSKVHVEDFYLACGCLANDAHALRALEGMLSNVERWIGQSGTVADDVRRAVRDRILTGEDGAPKLAQYSGRGPLEAWLRVSCVRAAASLGRSARNDLPLDAELEAQQLDPELALMKDRYGGELHDAFIDAMRRISVDERNLLRLHYLDGLSIEDVGRAYRISRATAARRLADARAAIVTSTLASLKQRLVVDTSEAESLLNLVRSQLDPELTKLL